MGSIRRHATWLAVALFAVFASAGVFSVLPAKTKGSFAEELAASDRLSERYERNEDLVVKYGLDDKEGEKLSAYTWDTSTKSFVAAPSMDATIVYTQSGKATGTVELVEGVEGEQALSFSGIAHGRAAVHLPSDATGMTISIWVKNLTTYWGSLAEFWDGTNGGRFGKGTLQLTQGQPFTWGYPGNQNGNCPSYDANKCVGPKSSFVTEMNTGDKGDGADDDMMVKEQWYQVTFTMTETEFKAYRDGELKQTFKNYNNAADNNITDILKNTLAAAKNPSGTFGLRLGNDDTGDRADILDDFRIYNGAMTAEEVTSLYNEYSGIRAIHGKTVKLEGNDTPFIVDNGSGISFESADDDFPKILIGNVTAEGVTEQGGTFSAAGDGFTYSYTVGDYVGDTRTATVEYVQDGTKYVFGVAQVNPEAKVVRLSSLKIRKNGGDAELLEGFSSDKYDYTVELSPDVYSVAFEVEVTEGGSSNVEEVNADIHYNGDNVIHTQAGADGGATVDYTVTLKRAEAHTAAPTVGGTALGYLEQNVYVDAIPETVTAEDIALAYPDGSEVKDLSFEKPTLTFKVEDKLTKSQTSYTVVYKTKEEGRIAYWSFDSSEDNTVFKGMRWDSATNGMKEDDALAMTVRQGVENNAVTDSRPTATATVVDGVRGNAIELAAWDYTTAEIPAVDGKTTGFTFSTWMKTNREKEWESVFTVLGSQYGTIFEKGVMQKHDIVDGQPKNSWEHLTDTWRGTWSDNSLTETEKGTKDAERAAFFNTPSEGASYVFYTVTVTYINGHGVVSFYKDGNLAAVFDDDTLLQGDGGSAATNKAKIVIEAINEGASVGLHRHHYDGGAASRFDEANVYAYAMTAEEVKEAYLSSHLNIAPEYIDVTGIGYPDLLFGGVDKVEDGEGGVKTATTSSGITYSYTPIQGPATPAKDAQGVEVTFTKGEESQKATVRFHRTVGLTVSALGYKIDGGENIAIPLPEQGTDITVKVPAGTDFTKIQAGTNTVTKFAEDNSDENYTVDFNYSATTKSADITFTYVPFPDQPIVYHVAFEEKSTATFVSMHVTGGVSEHDFTPEDFEGNEIDLSVRDLLDINITVTLTLAEGATAKNGNEQTFTQAEGGKITIEIENENGDTIIYTLNLVVLSDDAKLSSLTAEGFELSPAFSADTTEYVVNVKQGKGYEFYNALVCSAADTASVTKKYNRTDNVVEITVTAGNGVDKTVYHIFVREAALTAITADGELVEGFDPAVTSYTVTYGKTMPVIAASSYEGVEVTVGNAVNGVVTITVKAGSEQLSYTVTLKQLSSDCSLILKLNGTEITFQNGQGTYNAPAGTHMETISVDAEVGEGAAATWSYKDNSIEVVVVAEDGTSATYTVDVHFEEPAFGEGVTEDNSPKSGCNAAVGGMGALSLLAAVSVLVLLKKRKGGRS